MAFRRFRKPGRSRRFNRKGYGKSRKRIRSYTVSRGGIRL